MDIKCKATEKLPEYTGLKQEEKFNVSEQWDGHSCAICVGTIYDDGTKESMFMSDEENGTSELFDKLCSEIKLITEHKLVLKKETYELKGATRYYIPYQRIGHCSSKPTVTNSYVAGCIDTKYFVTYEILLVAGEGLKKYITIDFESSGMHAMHFYDHIHEMDDMFEEWFENGHNGFKIGYYGEKIVRFYDDLGAIHDLEINSIRELCSMINSLRVIKCDTIVSY